MIQPEVALWRAVLCQTLRDLTNTKNKDIREDALRWIFEASEDYVWVCESAGFEPRHFRRHVLEGLFLNRWLKQQRQKDPERVSLLKPGKPIRTLADACRHVRKAREMFCKWAEPQELQPMLDALTYRDCWDLCQDLTKETSYE